MCEDGSKGDGSWAETRKGKGRTAGGLMRRAVRLLPSLSLFFSKQGASS